MHLLNSGQPCIFTVALLGSAGHDWPRVLTNQAHSFQRTLTDQSFGCQATLFIKFADTQKLLARNQPKNRPGAGGVYSNALAVQYRA